MIHKFVKHTFVNYLRSVISSAIPLLRTIGFVLVFRDEKTSFKQGREHLSAETRATFVAHYFHHLQNPLWNATKRQDATGVLFFAFAQRGTPGANVQKRHVMVPIADLVAVFGTTLRDNTPFRNGRWPVERIDGPLHDYLELTPFVIDELYVPHLFCRSDDACAHQIKRRGLTKLVKPRR